MITVVFVNCLVIATAVIIHYEFLYRMTIFLPRLRISHRLIIVFGVFGALVAHSVEVWIFAFTYYFMNRNPGWGSFKGNFIGSIMDCGYFSFSTFTTLGFGDIEPIGDLRYLTGLEGLTGLVLITWTASFLFIEMQRYWKPK
jgi:hypothetical protein